MIVFDATLHVLQLIQDSEHVDELAQSEEIGLRHKVLPPLSVAQALHLAAEPLDGLALRGTGSGTTTATPPPTTSSLKKSIFGWGWRLQVPLCCSHAGKCCYKSLLINMLSA